MVFAFFAAWILGAALLLTCSALIWSERVGILRTLPACAKCGYSLVGLARTAKCPECGDIWRKFTAGTSSRVPANQTIFIWVTPAIAGLIVAGAVGAVARIPSPDSDLGTFTNALPFAATGLLLRLMLRWITLGAARTIMWCAIVALSLPLVAIMLVGALTNDLATSSKETYRIAPLMVFPFAGYGFAAGITLLAWLRSRPTTASSKRVL